MTACEITVVDRVAVATFSNPPVNAIGQEIRAGLIDAVARASANDAIDALVIACAGNTFFSGADIREFGKPPLDPSLPEVVDAIAACAKPVVAAVHGKALGGGLEVAMACHYRVADAGAGFGLPEVKLGLMPGARGTQSLPRLIGADAALPLIAFGTNVSAPDALRLGLVDRIARGDLVAEAVNFVRAQVGKPVPDLREHPATLSSPTLFDDFLRDNARKLRGLNAPPAIVEAVRAAVERPFEEGTALERELFLKLRAGLQSAALRHAFFAERECAKVPELAGVAPRPVRTVGLIGGGTMGRGIALAFLNAGLPVTLVEQAEPAMAAARIAIDKALDGDAAKGRISSERAETLKALLTTTTRYADLATVDLIVEAAFETMAVKRDIFGRLDQVARPGTILATNTSYLDIDEIAASTFRPHDVLGLHFFSPANIMKLLEIVRGAETAPDVIATGLAVAKVLGKVPVVSGNAYGFIGNRMLAVRRTQAEAMAVEGASPYAIDRIAEDFGFPMGPFRMGDLAGLDLGWSAETSKRATLRECFNEAGRRGQKAGAGFYDYDDKGRASPSPAAEEIIAGFAEDRGIARRDFTDDEILDRLLWPMVNEGFRILDDGIAQRASDVDAVWLNGYGWPRWTGGPMFHAEQTGHAKVRAALERMRIAPAGALADA